MTPFIPEEFKQRRGLTKIRRYNKYHNKPIWAYGFRFASINEYKRYEKLRLLEKARQITNLEVHPRYRLLVNGSWVCTYIADFKYQDEKGDTVVEDVKSPGTITPAFSIKKRLMKAVFGIDVRVVMELT